MSFSRLSFRKTKPFSLATLTLIVVSMISVSALALAKNSSKHNQAIHTDVTSGTPTGSYILEYKNANSSYYRSIHVSYPNAADKAQAKKRGVSAGGDIMIHGQKNGLGHLAAITQQRDWTDGCIAVTNDEMDEIMSVYKAGMPIEIVE